MRKNQSAFTLLELLVTLTVVAVLAVIAAPSFTSVIANNRSVTHAQDLLSAIRLARSEAIKRGARVSLCASANGTSCSGNWNAGWIVFADNATTDIAVPVVTSAARLQHHAGDTRATINVLKDGVGQSYIRFNSQGLLARATTDASPIVITSQYADCKGESARQILLSVAGNVSMLKQSCG